MPPRIPGQRSIDDISRAIGAIQSDISTVAKNQKEERDNAAQYRQEMRETVNEINRKVDSQEQTMKEVAPLVKKHEQWHQRRIGARQLLTLQWGLIIALVGMISWIVHEYLGRVLR